MARLVALVVAIGGLSLGWTAPAQAAPVDGTVLDASTGTGIVGAYVEAYGDVDLFDATTGAGGVYTLDLQPGLYDVYASADGFEGGYASVTVTDSTTTLPTIELQPLPDPVTVTGSIVDSSSGAGIGGADVTASGDGFDEATTAGDGSYTLNLPPGFYSIDAGAVGYQGGSAEVQVLESTTTLPTIELDPIQPGIYVTVWNDTFGGTMADAEVSLQPLGGGASTTVTTGQDGGAWFGNVAQGQYTVEVLAGNGVVPVGEPQVVDYTGGAAYVDLYAGIDLKCEPAAATAGLTNMGFENGLQGWTLAHQTESIEAVGADAFTSPWEGSAMARLGQSQPSNTETQPPGPNIMCQDFTVTDPEETFAFNVFTYDYTGFDQFDFDVVVTDPGTGETLASYQQGAWGEGTELKTSGWRGVRLDLSGHVGDTVRLTFRAGGTSDDLYAFWAYVDSAATLPPTVETSATDVKTTTGSVTTDPTTGQLTVSMPAGDPSSLTMTLPGACQDSSLTPTAVSLVLNGEQFAGTPVGGGLYEATIPVGSIASGPLSLQVVCPGETTVVIPIGRIVLYDPSGVVSDAVSGEPVVGAKVKLFKVPGWTPQGADGPYPAESCQTNLSKDAGAPWDQPAPTDVGQPVSAASPEISPNVNPFLTNNSGYFGWDVAEGCWYVEVDAEGYAPLTSPVVGVPTAVTDLDLELQPTALVNTAKPTIAGSPKVGDALTADPGTWNAGGATFGYQWFRGGSAISGATAKSYTPVAADVGQSLRVRVTASKAGYADGQAQSDQTAPVAPGTLSNTAVPTVSDTTPTVGEPVTAGDGTWSEASPGIAYQWFRGGSAISGATAKSYTPVAADVGQPLRVRVTASKAGYVDGQAQSAQTSPVTAGSFSNTALPTVSDTSPQVGEAVTAADGSWSEPGLSFAYQWFRGTTAISGATAKSYTPVAADVGQPLRVRVTASKAGYVDGQAQSAQTSPVAKGVITAAKPRIMGKPKVGKTLKARVGTSTPAAVKVKYQWLRNGKKIKHATRPAYKITKKDKHKKISVRVIRKAAGYKTLVLLSGAKRIR